MPQYLSPDQRTHAKYLRQNMTEAEKRLWSCLRAHRFMGLSVRRQVPVGPYIVDFLIPAHRLIIEADGGQHADNSTDARRDAYLAAKGYRTLRFWNADILSSTEAVLQSIADEVAR